MQGGDTAALAPKESFEWIDASTLEVELCGKRFRLYFLEASLVRCRYVNSPVFEEIPSYGVSPKYRPSPPLLQQSESALFFEVSSPKLTVRIRKEDAGVEFRRPRDGSVLCADAEGMGERFNDATGEKLVWMHKRMPKRAHFYGLGDKPADLNLRGRRLEMWASDHYKFGLNSDPLYKSIPFFICQNKKKCWGIFFDNTMRTYFDFGKERADRLLFGADGGRMDYYFFAGSRALEVIEGYTRLTGLPPMPPMWALGYHQSKWSYYPESTVQEIAQTMREHRLPCDAIHLDIHHMEAYQSFTWSNARFAEPKRMLDELESQGFKCVCIANPGIKVNPDNFVWRSGFERNVFCRRHDGALFSGEVWPGTCNFPDFTSPTAREWWAGLFKSQVGDLGVRGIWVDMNEPAIFPDKTFPDDTRHAYDGYSCSHLKAHNVYGQCMAKATRQGMERFAPARRPFVLSRAGFAGLQSYAATWTGDNSSTWLDLKLANLMVQRLASSGVSFCGSDVGGFLGYASGELFCRWMQMAAFHPFFRNHNNGEFGGQEPWCFGEKIEGYVRRALEERYRLLPYFYTQFYRYSTQGTPIIRSLPLMHTHQPDTYWRSSEFFVGDALYVVPVHYEGDIGRRLYIPEGVWYSLWDDSPAAPAGTESFVHTPIDHIPVMVKAGQMLARWPVQQYVGELKNPPLTWELWWAAHQHEQSSYFEDAGDGFGYRVGMFCNHSFSCVTGESDLLLNHSCEGALEPTHGHVDLVLHALPLESQPRLMIDGLPVACALVDAKGRLRIRISTSFRNLHLQF